MAGDATLTRREVTYDDVMSLRSAIDIDVSADGGVMSVVAQRRGEMVEPRLLRDGDALRGIEFTGTLFMVETATGALRGTWEWPEKVWNARVSPAGDRVVATATVDGVAGLWSAALDGSNPVRLVQEVERPSVPPVLGWTADGGAVVLVNEPSATTTQTASEVLVAPEGVTVDHLKSDPSRGLNAGVGGEAPRRSLLEVDVVTGRTRVIAAGLSLWSGAVSPDRQWVACIGEPSRVEMSSFSTYRSIEVRSVASGEVVASLDRVVSDSYNIALPVWHPSGRELAQLAEGGALLLGIDGSTREIRGSVPFRTDRGGAEVSLEPAWTPDGSHLVIGDAEGGLWAVDPADDSCRSIELPAHDGGVQLLTGPEGVLLTQPSERFLVVAQSPTSLERELWALSLDGDPPVQLPAPNTALRGPHVSGTTSVAAAGPEGGCHFYVADTAGRPSEVHCVGADGSVKQITDFNADFAGLALPTTRRLWFDHDGTKWTAFAFLPAGWSPGDGPIPFVIDSYPAGDLWGRTAESVGDAYRVVPPQLVTAQGWGLLVVGATPIRDANTRAGLIAPVLAALDALVASGMGDGRVALIGQSAGGYLVNCAVTATARFRAAVAFNGLANLSTHFGQLYVGAGVPLMHGTANAENMAGGLPWTVPDRYVEKSPLFHLHEVETPLLLVQGTGDMYAMVQGADEMYVGLRRLGKYVEILRYHGEGHGPTYYTEPNRRHLYSRVIEFLAELLD